MFSAEEHIDNLTRHIDAVRRNCILLGLRLIGQGRIEFARVLIANGFVHDASKFHGIEWMYLHTGPDAPKEKVELAVAQHQKTNAHHPEYWGGVDNMPEIYVAEMVCDWFARAQEFGTGLREWIKTQAVDRFGIAPDSLRRRWIDGFVDLLLDDSFVR